MTHKSEAQELINRAKISRDCALRYKQLRDRDYDITTIRRLRLQVLADLAGIQTINSAIIMQR